MSAQQFAPCIMPFASRRASVRRGIRDSVAQDKRIRYVDQDQKPAIGAKRDRAHDLARGETTRSGFITPPAFKLKPNGRKTVRGDGEPVEASNHGPEVMKPLLVIGTISEWPIAE